MRESPGYRYKMSYIRFSELETKRWIIITLRMVASKDGRNNRWNGVNYQKPKAGMLFKGTKGFVGYIKVGTDSDSLKLEIKLKGRLERSIPFTSAQACKVVWRSWRKASTEKISKYARLWMLFMARVRPSRCSWVKESICAREVTNQLMWICFIHLRWFHLVQNTSQKWGDLLFVLLILTSTWTRDPSIPPNMCAIRCAENAPQVSMYMTEQRSLYAACAAACMHIYSTGNVTMSVD